MLKFDLNWVRTEAGIVVRKQGLNAGDHRDVINSGVMREIQIWHMLYI